MWHLNIVPTLLWQVVVFSTATWRVQHSIHPKFGLSYKLMLDAVFLLEPKEAKRIVKTLILYSWAGVYIHKKEQV